MPNKKSAAKRMRQNAKRAERNKSAKSKMKSAIKSVLKALEEKNPDLVKSKLKEAISTINKIAKRGIIHKRNAARRESRLVRKVNDFLSNKSAPGAEKITTPPPAPPATE